MEYNYFEVLGISIDEIQGKDETTVKNLVNDAHAEQYKKTIGSYANVPRSDGLTQAQWQKVLIKAKDTLLDPEARRRHIADLTQEPEELTQSVLTFPGGEEASNITHLTDLMEKYDSIATDALYDGSLEENLRSAEQDLFANAARATVDRFPDDRDTGFMAIITLLRGEMRMQKGKGVSTPKQLARLIDKNWVQASTLLYNGFFAFWLEHTNQKQLAATANEITNDYTDQQDIGLETFVQKLDPKIGNPIPYISHPEIHLNVEDTGMKKAVQCKIRNVGRGFLYGKVQLANDIPGLHVSDTDIYGETVVNIDGNNLTADQVNDTSLVVRTNGKEMDVPIYINHGIKRLFFSVGLSGVLMAVLLLTTRLIMTQLPYTVWVGTFILGIGVYAHWLLVVTKSFSWQRILMPILPIKNLIYAQDHNKLVEVLVRLMKSVWKYIKWFARVYVKFVKSCFRWLRNIVVGAAGAYVLSPWATFGRLALVVFLALAVVFMLVGAPLFIMGTAVLSSIIGILYAMASPFILLAYIGTQIFHGLDKLFDLGFNLPLFVGWAFWGLVIGLVIQGYRTIGIYGQKRMKIWIAVAPLLLLALMGTIRYVSYSSASNSSMTEIAPVTTQDTTKLATETISDEASEQNSTEQTETEVKAKSIPSETPKVISNERDIAQSSSTEQSGAREPRQATPKQSTVTPPDPTPEPVTPAVPSVPVVTQQMTAEEDRTSNPSAEPVSTTKQSDPEPTPSEQAVVTPKQELKTTPTPEPKPITVSIPSEMVLIPAGEFQMGSNDNTDEKPVHTVYIDAFYIDKYEVTNAQYKAFIDANPQWRKDQIPSKYHNGNYLKHWHRDNYPTGKADHPVTSVSWYGAMAYAKWAEKRLPTEAEWEKAARGGKSGQQYPWGNAVSKGQANYGNHVGGTTIVGNYAANGYGIYDMAGNVFEWCLDAYYGDFYSSSPRRNPLAGVNTIDNADLILSDFTTVTTSRVARGGAWYNTEVQNVRVAYRNRVSPTLTNIALGFRCVKTITPIDRD